MSKLLFCADLCRNHGGSYAIAAEMIHQSHLAGADIVKVQSDDGLSSRHKQMAFEAHQLGLQVALTVRTAADITPRSTSLHFDYLKIGSGECLNECLIAAVRDDGRPWILSTGGTTEEQHSRIWQLSEGGAIVCECVSSYPNEPSEIRLGWLEHLLSVATQRGWRVGYSDHMQSHYMSLAAIALGVVYIEKHLSLDVLRRDANHSSSISPAEFKQMVRDGRAISEARRNTKKDVLPRELSTGKLSEYRARYTEVV